MHRESSMIVVRCWCAHFVWCRARCKGQRRQPVSRMGCTQVQQLNNAPASAYSTCQLGIVPAYTHASKLMQRDCRGWQDLTTCAALSAALHLTACT
jgi:hypothetical protein